MENPFDNRIQTVSELTGSIRGLLETAYSMVTVTGEISNLRRPSSGHLYFTLKDAGAQLRAVLFKGQQRYLACVPADGLEVLCRGRISVYEPRGEYQLIVDFMDGKGTGLLRIAFDRLKARLEAEGLFDQARKRPLPFLPRRIALVTSPQGAAVRDFLIQARKLAPATAIEILPVRVQGEEAAGEIAAAIELLNRRGLSEVIVLCRGGGSLEDLRAFNEEVVARAIAASRVPVVSAVGHEVDFTIADFVADLRAPTPTAAAGMILPDQGLLLLQIRELQRQLATAMKRHLAEARRQLEAEQRQLRDPALLLAGHAMRLDHLRAELAHAAAANCRQHRQRFAALFAALLAREPRRRLQRHRAEIQEHHLRLCFLIRRQLSEKRGRFSRAVAILDAVSPLAVLARGYAIARLPDGTVLRSTRQAPPGTALRLTVSDGDLACLTVKRELSSGTP